jgi:hypothetical protein
MATIQNILNSVFDSVDGKLKADVSVDVTEIESITNDVTVKNSTSSPTLAVDQKPSSTFAAATKSNITVKVQLDAEPCHQLILYPDTGNTVNVMIGDTTNQVVALPAWAIQIPVSNANLIFVKSSVPATPVVLHYIIL